MKAKRKPAKRAPSGIKHLLFNTRAQNAVIIAEAALIAGVLVVASLPSVRSAFREATSRQPERLTELYFPNNQLLPLTYTPGETLQVSFVIHNLEGENMNYPFQISLTAGSSQHTLATNAISTVDGQTSLVKVPVIVSSVAPRVSLNVALPTANEAIHFWMRKV